MAFGNVTATITVNAVAKTLKRISTKDTSSVYYLREATQEFTLNVKNAREAPQKTGIQYDRHTIEIIQTVFATETAPAISRIVYTTIRNQRMDNFDAVKHIAIAQNSLVSASGNLDDVLQFVS